MAFDLLSKWTIDQIRKDCSNWRIQKDFDGLEHKFFNSFVLEYGSPEIVKATGRARCRCCGEKIAKGEDALKFFYDFNGCGSWTTVEVQMHVSGCNPATKFS